MATDECMKNSCEIAIDIYSVQIYSQGDRYRDKNAIRYKNMCLLNLQQNGGNPNKST